jgi:hypothetical protein
MRRARNIIPAALGALIAFLGVMAPIAGARVESEIAPPDKRRVSVDKATLLAKQAKAEPLPANLSLPFAPPGFDLTDAEEAAAAAAAAMLANRGNPAAPAPPSDHQLLMEIAAKIRPSGTFMLGGKPLLAIGKSFVKTGSHFTITYKGTDYDLELTEIDGSNFTLRYKSEEITRPIQTGKSP